MKDHEIRLWLKDLFSNVPEAKREFERNIGMNPDNLPDWMLHGGIETMVDKETLRRKDEREYQIRESEHEFLAKLEQAKAEALRYSLNEAARIIREGNREDAQRLEQILTSIQQGYQMLQSSQQQEKYLPLPHIDYTDCWRKHPATEEFPAGRPGPSQCIQTYAESDGIHYRCLVAYAAQTPSDSGFARLKYQIFHAELLRQGDCPRPLSRSITRRIPGVSWLLVKPDVCPLADGSEYVMGKEGLKRASD